MICATASAGAPIIQLCVSLLARIMIFLWYRIVDGDMGLSTVQLPMTQLASWGLSYSHYRQRCLDGTQGRFVVGCPVKAANHFPQ
mmetsp:Transcript_42475/g.77608  ORF Transcript_42475/g.77608 Transcript_42475/m.77608 type:complete len:85 (+) Transcript_42475:292-546(+)